MWGAVLSDPLPIVGTVSRCPAVYLMGRMPIPSRLAAFQEAPCGAASYGVLISLSGGCPPARARLHTRYAPVRRSPAPCRQGPLPLDLHVLGLSLAFILSQDQTLRCMTFFVYLFPAPDRRLRAAGPRGRAVLACLVRHSQCVNVLRLRRQGWPRWPSLSEDGCKGRDFSLPRKGAGRDFLGRGRRNLYNIMRHRILHIC